MHFNQSYMNARRAGPRMGADFIGPRMPGRLRTGGMRQAAMAPTRLGIGGGAALLAFSHGRKALESMRYGEIGHTLIHAGIAGGAGYLGYHALTNSNTFRVGAGQLAKTILSKNSRGNAAGMGRTISSIANAIGRMA